MKDIYEFLRVSDQRRPNLGDTITAKAPKVDGEYLVTWPPYTER